jgi:leader peptidase (prepilin peptidase) / N-methyltransferase
LDFPTIIWPVFLFLIGASVGSFLNVVVYRLPQVKSIVRPGSHCTSCQTPIAWYDNIPIVAWFFLRGKCRHCDAAFSIRYPLVELFTALLFVMVYGAYFSLEIRSGLPTFTAGGWVIYSGHMVLLCALLASSLIDAEHWIIPLSVSYTAVVIAVILSMIWPYLLTEPSKDFWRLIPYGSVRTAALALGSLLGLAISFICLKFGWITRSFHEVIEAENEARKKNAEPPDFPVNIRAEMVRELAFLAPILMAALLATQILNGPNALAQKWEIFIQGQKWAAGLLGSVYGFMIGAGVVWATRILGSLAFGKEAMGLGDVHLMAAVGAMLGWACPAIAFFGAPFIALGWALARLILHRTREIPYGPFLSVATLVVMIMHDKIIAYFQHYMTPPTMP